MTERRGVTTIELVCAAVIMSAVTVTLVPALYWQTRQRETSAEHLEVITALDNIMDELTSRPYDELDTESMAAVPLPDWIEQQLDQPRLSINAREQAGGKQITAEISWRPSHAAVREKVELQAWVFRAGSA